MVDGTDSVLTARVAGRAVSFGDGCRLFNAAEIEGFGHGTRSAGCRGCALVFRSSAMSWMA